MTPEEMAALHARVFTAPPPWSAAAFAASLADPAVFCCHVPGGFLLGRVAAGEAELLTLAVAPERRRRGVGRALVEAFLAEAARRGAREAFLEVADDNAAARALYAACGWVEAGRRRGYLRAPDGSARDALLLRHPLAATPPPPAPPSSP